ncbi:protein adenylyltransferase SelO [Aliidiomarina sp. Khilg15.8]
MRDFRTEHSYAQLPPALFESTAPTPVADPQWVAFNHALADELNLPLEYRATDEGLQLFSGNQVPNWAQPLAQAYAGHQFASFVPQLGDGRAVLLAEIIDNQEQRRDLQLKGAGRTPYSRGGDGRSPLGPVMREYLISEAMHQLGVPTTRALAAVASGEAVQRETPLPGALMARVASSHIRVGTFQFLAARANTEGLTALADHVIARHYPQVADSESPYLDLLEAVIARQADLVAQWMSFGFIHGVMNTDNCSIAGETIDYGPCAFMDEYHADTVFSSIDRRGRYAYSKQPVIMQWNMARFAECLIPIIAGDENDVVEKATQIIQQAASAYDTAWLQRMGAKFGLRNPQPEDKALIEEFLQLMADNQTDFTGTFRDLCDASKHSQAFKRFKNRSAVEAWTARWQQRLTQQGTPLTEVSARMKQVNPARIPRNHLVAQAIEAAEQDGDLRPFNRLQEALADPFSDDAQFADLARAPTAGERVKNTFCGT